MAPSSGFEPLTARLTAGCSDQLSYDGTIAPLFTPCLKASGTKQQRHRQFPAIVCAVLQRKVYTQTDLSGYDSINTATVLPTYSCFI